MSTLGIVIAAAAIAPPAIVAAPAAPEAPLEHALSLSIPSTDGARGGLVMYERFVPERRLALGATAELRETAIGSYTGVRAGVGAQIRYFWRANAWLSRLHAGEMVGWFVGGGVHAGIDVTHDNVDHRWLGTAIELGLTASVGYRIAPWRHLIVTPSTGLAVHHDIDVSGRLPGWNRGGLVVGLEVGWLY